MLTFRGQTRQRARKLVVKFTASTFLPAIGWSKCVEAVITGGPLLEWVVYTVVITTLWILADDIQRAASEAVEEATDGS